MKPIHTSSLSVLEDLTTNRNVLMRGALHGVVPVSNRRGWKFTRPGNGKPAFDWRSVDGWELRIHAPNIVVGRETVSSVFRREVHKSNL